MKRIRNASLMTAIKTPYLSSGDIDYDTYDSLIERQIASQVQGVVVGGTTGEGHLLNWEEHIKLITHTVKQYSKKLIIIGNTGSNNTREAYKATNQGFEAGMDAALQINPYYGKTSGEGVFQHLDRLLKIGPAVIYNVESRTGQDIPIHLMERIIGENEKNFVGIKECAGNERISYYEKKGIACWSGNDDQCFEGRHEAGSHGVISVTSNVVPSLMRNIIDNNDESMNNNLWSLFKWLFCAPNPIPLNTLLPMMGLVKPIFRLPYVPLSQVARKKGLEILSKLETLDIPTNLRILSDDEYQLI